MAEEETKVQSEDKNDSSASPFSEQLSVMSPTPSEILRPEG